MKRIFTVKKIEDAKAVILKELLEQRHMTGTQLSEALGFGNNYIYRFLTVNKEGKRYQQDLPDDVWSKVASILSTPEEKLTAADILRRAEEKKR